jgi:hypothetical protein
MFPPPPPQSREIEGINVCGARNQKRERETLSRSLLAINSLQHFQQKVEEAEEEVFRTPNDIPR